MINFWMSLLAVVNAMSPYLLLGFLIAGVSLKQVLLCAPGC